MIIPALVVERCIAGRVHAYCCLGCAFIAEQLALTRAVQRDVAALNDGGSAARRSNAASPGGAGPNARPVDPMGLPIDAPSARPLDLAIDGMVCSACALLLEHRLGREPGVRRVDVDFAARRAHFAIDPEVTNAKRLAAAIAKTGYRVVEPADTSQQRRGARVELARVLIAWLAMMQVMMLALPAYVTQPGDVPPDIEQLLRIAQLVLTVPVLLFSAAPLFRAAWSQCRARFVGMDLPVALGLVAATAASVHATVVADGAVYFDSITMFVAFVMASRWLQARALARTRQRIDGAEAAARTRAQRLRAWPGSLAADPVPAESLASADLVLVAAGETVPADGRVVHGMSTVSLAWITGESTPVPVADGQRVLAGSVNLEQALVVRVTGAGEATSLASLRRLADEAARARPAIVEAGNRVARAFLWTVLAITAATATGWWFVDPALALPSSLAVLVATCPCALSLAAPAAFAAAQERLARSGVLTARLAAIERLAKVDVFASDKTGTLTAAQPALERVTVVDDAAIGRRDVVDNACTGEPGVVGDACAGECNFADDAGAPERDAAGIRALSIAASLESLSTHPFGRAIAAAAQAREVPVTAPQSAEVATGRGVEGVVDGRRYRLGTRDYTLELVSRDRRAAAAARLALAICADTAGRATDVELDLDFAEEADGGSVVMLGDADGILAVFRISERPRADAVAFADSLRAAGIDLHVVSGDRAAPVRRLASTLSLDPRTHAYAQQSPDDKRRFVAGLQARGHRVAMLGDGMNDAPVIAQADVSFALASELGGTALAQTRADFIVASDRLSSVAGAVQTARRGLRIVRQNFGWAFVYNVAAIPLAAFGYLTPALAAAGMAASSLLVVGNALRLLREPRNPPRYP